MIRLLRRVLAIGVILSLAAGGWFYLQVSTPLALTGERVEFHIAPGSGMRVAAREIAGSGVDVDPWKLVLLGRLLRVEGAIKAGSEDGLIPAWILAAGEIAVNMGQGLAALWTVPVMLLLQGVFAAVFLYTGRSSVTGSAVRFFVKEGEI